MDQKVSNEGKGNVAIVGRPNVGKSALFNRLAQRKIAIVHDQPGITRDRLVAICRLGRLPFRVWDTGGIGGGGESELRAEVRQSAEIAIRESELILFVVDAQAGLTPIDQELAKMLRQSSTPVLLVINKVDHPKHENLETDFARLGFANLVSISAAHGRGISDLVEEIDSMLPVSGVMVDRTLAFPLRKKNDSDLSQATSSQLTDTAPLALAIIGRPNAGKSSLINSILRDSRTIVSDQPGTTRDAVDIFYQRNGEEFLLIDTAGIRARSKHASPVEVFSVMRAEGTIRRADLCLLVIDLTSGVTSQDKSIAGLIQKAEKPCLIILNKWDLIKPKRSSRTAMATAVAETRERLFFLEYASCLVTSAVTGENLGRLFQLIAEVRQAARAHIGTGVLNRLLHSALRENPPPLVGGRRLKLFYASQIISEKKQALDAQRFVLFVNQPKLLGDTYKRYLESRIRAAVPYPSLPVVFRCRARSKPPVS